MASRLFIGSYFSFRLFFYIERRKENSDFMEKFYFLSFFHTFSKYAFILYDNKKSKKKNGDDQPIDENIISTSKRWFSRNSTIAYIFLYCKNFTVRYNIKEKKCDHILYSLEKSHIVESLHIEKKIFFTFNERKPFFFFASQEFFGKITSRCYNFYKKLDYFQYSILKM